MAIYHPSSVTCRCGNTFPVHVARTLNARRSPDVRDRILRLELHRVVCPRCEEVLAVERPFSYVDPDRNAVFFVQPRGARVGHRRDSARLAAAAAGLPPRLSAAKGRQARVVYGLDELREKLVAQDLALDDRVVELLKALVVYEHPFLMRRARLQLFLTGAEGDRLRFVAYHHNRNEGWEIRMPRTIADDLAGRERELRAWARGAHREPIFDLPDAWVNIRRWTLRYRPLEALRTFADAVRAGREIALEGEEFERMVKRLPRGNQLPGSAKQDLATLFEHAKRKGSEAAQEKLLEVRFGVELEDEWALNDRPNDIDTIWQLLASVPVTNVEGNTSLRDIQLVAGSGGVYFNGVIEIGERELGRRESFEDVLRHEVGHAVHEEKDAIVTPWLEERFGWRVFRPTRTGIGEWVKLMGGWGDVAGRARDEIVQALQMAAGPGERWGPGRAPRPPSGHPWWGKDFGPRLAYERSGEDWFRNFRTWHRARGHAFFVNFWYGELMAVAAATLDEFVARMPDDYAAMSPHEFFAEIYALYYDQDDPMRRVVADDAEVSGWLDRHIGRWDPKSPRKPGARRAAKTVRRRPGATRGAARAR
jgi:hypothetical protein